MKKTTNALLAARLTKRMPDTSPAGHLVQPITSIFENIDDNPAPEDIRISWFASDQRALRVGHYLNPLLSICQEPSIVVLPDGRLFCTLRTMTGYIWYSLSGDDGTTCGHADRTRRERPADGGSR